MTVCVIIALGVRGIPWQFTISKPINEITNLSMSHFENFEFQLADKCP